MHTFSFVDVAAELLVDGRHFADILHIVREENQADVIRVVVCLRSVHEKTKFVV